MNASMHPVLSRRGYLGVYLGVWLVFACLLLFLVSVSGGIRFQEVLILLIPMSVLYAGVCLPAWYACRATPPRAGGFTRLAVTHLTAAFAMGYIWTQLGSAYAGLLARTARFPQIAAHYLTHQPILLVAGVLLYLLTVGFFYVVVAIESARETEKLAAETAMLARDAELRALRAQINPHFLFNSLNSISALTSIDASRAREMCLLLADFLRLTLGMGEKSVIPLAEELDLLEKFMAIEKVRFGDRLRIEEHISAESKRCSIPPLLLQPLFENAVSHGIASMADGGLIRCDAGVHDGRLLLTVENDRDEEAPARKKRSGVGLKNVRSRLETRYGKNAALSIDASEDKFRVSLSLPAEYAAAEPQVQAALQTGAAS